MCVVNRTARPRAACQTNFGWILRSSCQCVVHTCETGAVKITSRWVCIAHRTLNEFECRMPNSGLATGCSQIAHTANEDQPSQFILGRIVIECGHPRHTTDIDSAVKRIVKQCIHNLSAVNPILVGRSLYWDCHTVYSQLHRWSVQITESIRWQVASTKLHQVQAQKNTRPHTG